MPSFTAEQFQTNVDALCEKIMEKPKNLDEETGRVWTEISFSFYTFDRRERKAAILRSTTLENTIAFAHRFLLAGSADRTKFSSQFFGKNTEYPPHSTDGDRVRVISDPAAFKRSMPLQAVNL